MALKCYTRQKTLDFSYTFRYYNLSSKQPLWNLTYPVPTAQFREETDMTKATQTYLTRGTESDLPKQKRPFSKRGLNANPNC